MSKPERTSRRQAKGEPSDTPFDDLDTGTAVPEVLATPKSDGKTAAPIQASSSISTTSPKATPKPTAPLTQSSQKITMKDIQSMMAKTALDITTDLNAKHKQEMQSQQDAMRKLENEFKALKLTHLNKSIEKDTQASPFETPRATRPQDLAYQQIRTSSKIAKVMETTTDTTPVLNAQQESMSDKTLQALVKMMDATIKNTNAKDTTTDLPKFTGKDAQ